MKNSWITSLILACIIGSCLFWLRGKMLSYAVIENRSGQEIKTMEIVLGTRRMAFRNVPAGDFRWARFTITRDDHFQVTGELADGKSIHGSYGYVTGGMSGVRASFKIEPGGTITFKQN